MMLSGSPLGPRLDGDLEGAGKGRLPACFSPLTPHTGALHPNKVLLGSGAKREFLMGVRSFVEKAFSTRNYSASCPYPLLPLTL